MHIDITCFKAYDIRGRVPEQLNENVAYRVGRAFVSFLSATSVVVGHDVRLTSPALADSLIKGMIDAGANVIHIGECGTEEVYFGTFHLQTDGGIMVTASHNPIDYNGMKFVAKGSKPISSDSGLKLIQTMAERGEFDDVDQQGNITHQNIRTHYIQHLLSYIDVNALKPLKVVVNAGNGGAGVIIDGIEDYLPIEFIKIHHQADGSFPNGIPNPLLVDNRQSTIDAIIKHNADIGVAWDGDFDRCFLFDEKGNFIEGYYIVGLLAEAFLLKNQAAKIVHDPRLIWNTIDIVDSNNGTAIECKTGHAFIKERMRLEDAVYGGEMSAHHYFRDFAYCDNGNIPWLLVVELMSNRQTKLSGMIGDRIKRFPCSGEINNTVKSPAIIIDSIEQYYALEAESISHVDGLSMDFGKWRFNIRMSSTEPVLRLNIESKGDQQRMQEKIQEVLSLVERFDCSVSQ